MVMKNKTYDVLKWIALVLLPAVQVLWLALGKTWDFPYLTEVGATIAAIDAFLGSLLGVSGMRYTEELTEEEAEMVIEEEEAEDDE